MKTGIEFGGMAIYQHRIETIGLNERPSFELDSATLNIKVHGPLMSFSGEVELNPNELQELNTLLQRIEQRASDQIIKMGMVDCNRWPSQLTS